MTNKKEMRRIINLLEDNVVDFSMAKQDRERDIEQNREMPQTDADKYDAAVAKQQGYPTTEEEILEAKKDLLNDVTEIVWAVAQSTDHAGRGRNNSNKSRLIDFEHYIDTFQSKIYFPPPKYGRVESYIDEIYQEIEKIKGWDVDVDPDDERVLIVTGLFK